MTNARQARARRAAIETRRPAHHPGPRRPPGRPAGARRPPVRPPSRRWWSRRRLAAAVAVIAVLGVTVGGLVGGLGGAPSMSAVSITGPPGPEGIPLETGRVLAPAAGAAMGEAVDGIGCDAGEQLVYHVHTHLAVYLDGHLRPLPAGIGIVTPVVEQTPEGGFDEATTCYYWLHVHAQDGVIHIESPTVRGYTLGQFFDIWRQPLGPDRIAGVRGRLTVFVNGRLFGSDPRSILLGSHEDVQIDVGRPVVPPGRVDWTGTGL